MLRLGAHLHPRSLRQRVAWMCAASALTLTLALGGCRAGAVHQTTQPSGASTSSATGAGASSNSAALQQLQSIDTTNQSDTQQLNSVQSDAGVNYSSQESQTLP